LINNAGFSLSGVFESISREKIRELFDVNVFGVMDVTRAILPHFRKNKAGVIVNISSRAGLVGMPMISSYSATKYALEGFSESLSYELASRNILVKIVEPSGGVTSTNFSDRMRREYAPDSMPGDYSKFVEHAGAVYAGMEARRKTGADEVAKTVYEAATDNTSRLRYFIGEDVGGFVQAKRDMTDEAFGEFMRSRFRPKQ